MKRVLFLGDSLLVLRGFPTRARQRAGYQLERVQRGLEPESWKPLAAIGAGVREIRVRDQTGAFRVEVPTMRRRRYRDVWEAIEGPGREAASLRARSALMVEISELIRRSSWTQRQAAARFGVTQPRISDLMRGRIDLFSLDTLVDMAEAGGLKPRMTVKRAA